MGELWASSSGGPVRSPLRARPDRVFSRQRRNSHEAPSLPFSGRSTAEIPQLFDLKEMAERKSGTEAQQLRPHPKS
jgi:hypothetical protein